MLPGVDDEERHRSHFGAREDAVASRPAQRYELGFENIRKLQRWVKSQALSHGVPVIPNYSFDQAIAAVTDLVMERATARAAELRARGDAAFDDHHVPAASPDGGRELDRNHQPDPERDRVRDRGREKEGKSA